MKLKNPMVVARSGDLVLLVSADDLGNPHAQAQTWTPTDGYSNLTPLQVWFKFLYYLTDVIPPEPWPGQDVAINNP